MITLISNEGKKVVVPNGAKERLLSIGYSELNVEGAKIAQEAARAAMAKASDQGEGLTGYVKPKKPLSQWSAAQIAKYVSEYKLLTLEEMKAKKPSEVKEIIKEHLAK